MGSTVYGTSTYTYLTEPVDFCGGARGLGFTSREVDWTLFVSLGSVPRLRFFLLNFNDLLSGCRQWCILVEIRVHCQVSGTSDRFVGP